MLRVNRRSIPNALRNVRVAHDVPTILEEPSDDEAPQEAPTPTRITADIEMAEQQQQQAAAAVREEGGIADILVAPPAEQPTTEGLAPADILVAPVDRAQSSRRLPEEQEQQTIEEQQPPIVAAQAAQIPEADIRVAPGDRLQAALPPDADIIVAPGDGMQEVPPIQGPPAEGLQQPQIIEDAPTGEPGNPGARDIIVPADRKSVV